MAYGCFVLFDNGESSDWRLSGKPGYLFNALLNLQWDRTKPFRGSYRIWAPAHRMFLLEPIYVHELSPVIAKQIAQMCPPVCTHSQRVETVAEVTEARNDVTRKLSTRYTLTRQGTVRCTSSHRDLDQQTR